MGEVKRYPVRIMNDFHKHEGDWENGWKVALNLRSTPPEVLVPGTRVFLYDSGDIEGEGIVQRGERYDWVAEIIPGTFRAPGDEGYTNGRGPDPDAPEDDPGAIPSASMKDGPQDG